MTTPKLPANSWARRWHNSPCNKAAGPQNVPAARLPFCLIDLIFGQFFCSVNNPLDALTLYISGQRAVCTDNQPRAAGFFHQLPGKRSNLFPRTVVQQSGFAVIKSAKHGLSKELAALGQAHPLNKYRPVKHSGGVILPKLLDELGVSYDVLNGTPDGDFAHNPEPLEKNLGGIMERMRGGGFDLGIVVDPDVDRLAFICEDGRMFGEEYTLVSVADYVLGYTPGNTVSNLSSTRALRDVTERHGGHYTASAVGEVNVTTKMKEVGAVIGGEGNGGVIYPESHYGRDALVGIALFLSSLAQKGCKASELRATFPNYYIAKNRIDLTPTTDIDAILAKVKQMYADQQVNDIDGVKIDFPDKWVHLRKSNTEPIIRVYSEAATMEEADALGKQIMKVVSEFGK